MFNRTLMARIRGATAVLCTEVGTFDPHRGAQQRNLLRVDDADELQTLTESLAIDDSSIAESASLMARGDVQLNFLVGDEAVASLILLLPDVLRWNELPADARLLDPGIAGAWLAKRGWVAPPRIRFPAQRIDGTAVVELDLVVAPGHPLEDARTAVGDWLETFAAAHPRTSPPMPHFDVWADLVEPPAVRLVDGRLYLRFHLRHAHAKGWNDWFGIFTAPELVRAHPWLSIGKVLSF